MTVNELIDLLETFPRDMKVVIEVDDLDWLYDPSVARMDAWRCADGRLVELRRGDGVPETVVCLNAEGVDVNPIN